MKADGLQTAVVLSLRNCNSAWPLVPIRGQVFRRFRIRTRETAPDARRWRRMQAPCHTAIRRSPTRAVWLWERDGRKTMGRGGTARDDRTSRLTRLPAGRCLALFRCGVSAPSATVTPAVAVSAVVSPAVAAVGMVMLVVAETEVQ